MEQINIPLIVQTVKLLNNAVFWDVAPCKLEEVYRRFGGTCASRVQPRRYSQQFLVDRC